MTKSYYGILLQGDKNIKVFKVHCFSFKLQFKGKSYISHDPKWTQMRNSVRSLTHVKQYTIRYLNVTVTLLLHRE